MLTKSAWVVERSPVFYGWVVWVIATLGTVATAPGQTFTVSWFYDYFITDLNLDRTTIASLYSLGTVAGALSLTWIGRQIDRYGNRRAATTIGVMFAAAVALLSTVTGWVGLLVGFMAIRGLGQGALGLSHSTAIAQWFRRKRGRMISLTTVTFALFQSAYVPWLQDMLEAHAWRQIWVLLGAGVGAAAIPLVWLLLRDTPEMFGLLPDGEAQPVVKPEAPPLAHAEDNWTLNEAMRTAVFWVFLTGSFILPTWGTGLILHQVSLFGALGHSPDIVAETFSSFALITAGISLAAGVLVDRLAPNRFLALQITAALVAMVTAMVMTETWMLTVYAVAFGIALGSSGVFNGTVWVNLFGRKHQGMIRGFVSTVLAAGSGVGPILFALSYDHLGGYGPALWAGVALVVAVLALSFFVNKPQRRKVH